MKTHGVQGASLSLDSVDAARHDAFRHLPGAWQRRHPRDRGAPGREHRLLAPHERHRLERRRDSRDDRPRAGARRARPQLLLPRPDRPRRRAHRHHARAVRGDPDLPGAGAGRGRARPDGARAGRPCSSGARIPGACRSGAPAASSSARSARRTSGGCSTSWIPRSPLLANYAHGSCPAGKYYCRITPTGDVTPCPYMPVAAGNLRETGFAELWERAQVFTDLRTSRLGGRCGACEFRELCGGCRCRAYATYGDYLAEDPACGYQPGAHGGELIRLGRRADVRARGALRARVGAGGPGAARRDPGVRPRRWSSRRSRPTRAARARRR